MTNSQEMKLLNTQIEELQKKINQKETEISELKEMLNELYNKRKKLTIKEDQKKLEERESIINSIEDRLKMLPKQYIEDILKQIESYEDLELFDDDLKDTVTQKETLIIKENLNTLNKPNIEIKENTKENEKQESEIIKNMKPQEGYYYFKLDNYMVESKTLKENFYELIYYLATNIHYKDKLEVFFKPKPSPLYFLGNIKTDYTEPIFKINISPNDQSKEKKPLNINGKEVTEIHNQLKRKERINIIEKLNELLNITIIHNYDEKLEKNLQKEKTK